MQKITTKIFKYVSILFGVVGLILVLFGGPNDNIPLSQFLMRILLCCVFIILPSFALSVASKYLEDKKSNSYKSCTNNENLTHQY